MEQELLLVPMQGYCTTVEFDGVVLMVLLLPNRPWVPGATATVVPTGFPLVFIIAPLVVLSTSEVAIDVEPLSA